MKQKLVKIFIKIYFSILPTVLPPKNIFENPCLCTKFISEEVRPFKGAHSNNTFSNARLYEGVIVVFFLF